MKNQLPLLVFFTLILNACAASRGIYTPENPILPDHFARVDTLGSSLTAPSKLRSSSEQYLLPSDQKQVFDQFISVFENSTTVLQYGYIENLNDGRGFTAGRAGFTSRDGDMLDVVRYYLTLNPQSSLALYLPRLIALNDEGSDATLGLENLPLAWAEASEDPNFKAAQDYISDQLYYLPAVKRAKKFNIKSDLGILCFYDTAIQHGVDGEEGLDNIISRLGRRSHYESEATYLNEFLKVRRGILMDPVDKSTRKVWQESVGRVDTLQAILLSKRLNQLAPMTISPFDESESYLIQRIEQP